jgi:hypothetical protein
MRTPSGFQSYGKKPLNIRFKAQTVNTQQAEPGTVTRPSHTASLLQIQLNNQEETLALTFFVNDFAINGRSLESSRGYFESIVPIFKAAHSGSTISRAVAAISTLLFSGWQRSTRILELSHLRLGQALQQLRADLKEPAIRSKDETLLSILVLQCYENARAVTQLDKADRIHHDGAINLIKSLGLGGFQSDHAKRLLLYVLNTEVSSALRESRTVDSELAMWCKSATDMPWNTSSRLDMIGITVADIQKNFVHLSQVIDSGSASVDTFNDLKAMYAHLNSVTEALGAWVQFVPQDWQPLRFSASKQTDPPVEMYLDTFEIYPSIQIASIWNTWRSYSLIMLEIQNHLNERLSDAFVSVPEFIEHSPLLYHIQEFVDSVCYSLPFYLGNQTEHCSWVLEMAKCNGSGINFFAWLRCSTSIKGHFVTR